MEKLFCSCFSAHLRKPHQPEVVKRKSPRLIQQSQGLAKIFCQDEEKMRGMNREMQPCCCWGCHWSFVGVMGRRQGYPTARQPGSSQGLDSDCA